MNMKYTISDENRWTTLAAVIDNQLCGVYPPNFWFDGGSTYESCLDVEPTVYKIKGEYPHARVFVDLSQAIKPDYKHISSEEWNSIVNESQDDLDIRQAQDEIVNVWKEARRAYFGDTKKQEQELYRSIREGLADMYDDGYNDGKHSFDKDYRNLQGRYEFMLDACMEYMREVLSNIGVI